MPRIKLFVGAVLLLLGGVQPVFATVNCFHYRVIIETRYQRCEESCTECDFIGPHGEDLGYILDCIDLGCIDRVM